MMENDSEYNNISPILLILILILIYIVIVYILQFSWNSSITKIFNVPTVSFSEAFGLLIVSMILFKM
jgi:uncharacterized membrane protein